MNALIFSHLNCTISIMQLTLVLLVANLANNKNDAKNVNMTETLAHGYSSGRSQRKISNEYQYDRVIMDFKSICVLVLWTKVALALEGLTQTGRPPSSQKTYSSPTVPH